MSAQVMKTFRAFAIAQNFDKIPIQFCLCIKSINNFANDLLFDSRSVFFCSDSKLKFGFPKRAQPSIASALHNQLKYI